MSKIPYYNLCNPSFYILARGQERLKLKNRQQDPSAETVKEVLLPMARPRT